MQTPLNEFLGSEFYRTDNPKDSFQPSKREKQSLTTDDHVSSLPCRVLLGKHKACGLAKTRFDSDTAFIACICLEFKLKLC